MIWLLAVASPRQHRNTLRLVPCLDNQLHVGSNSEEQVFLLCLRMTEMRRLPLQAAMILTLKLQVALANALYTLSYQWIWHVDITRIEQKSAYYHEDYIFAKFQSCSINNSVIKGLKIYYKV